MGIIYKLQNNVNNKIYIGQTVYTLEKRLKQHVFSAKQDQKLKEGSLHFDIRKYGIENFTCSVLERCENSRLQERESFYIRKYNSFENGYNLTRGGQKYLEIQDKAREKIIELIQAGKSATDIVADVGYQIPTIERIAQAEGLLLNRAYRQKNLEVLKYQNRYEIIASYESIQAAYNQEEISVSLSTFQHNVRRACGTGELLYGYYWILKEDMYEIVNGQVCEFKQILDRQLYLKGANYKIENNFIVQDISLADQLKLKELHCAYCGDVIDSGNVCLKCVLKHPRGFYASEYITSHKEELKKAVESGQIDLKLRGLYDKKDLRSKLPDKETLQKLIAVHPYRTIAKMYGVHEKTLRDELKRLGIYERRIQQGLNDIDIAIDILKYGRKEAAEKNNISQWKIQEVTKKLNIPKWLYDNSKPILAVNIATQEKSVFESFKEAARTLQNSKENTQAINSLGYRIGEAAKKNKIYMGYKWLILDKNAEKERLIQELMLKKQK